MYRGRTCLTLYPHRCAEFDLVVAIGQAPPTRTASPAMHSPSSSTYTAADLADLGIPTEGIEMVMEDQDAEGRARVGAGGW